MDKYTWVDLGSSYLPSDVLAAFLRGQLMVMVALGVVYAVAEAVGGQRVARLVGPRVLSVQAMISVALPASFMRTACSTATRPA